jgi:glycosyltransferase involved in cell wall biosynthesis
VRGLEVLLLCGQDADPAIVAEFGAAPFFAIGVGAQMRPDPARPAYENDPFVLQGTQALTLSAHFFFDFQRMTALLRPTDQVFFPALFASELLAFAQWLTLLPGEGRPFTTILLRAWFDEPHFRAIFELCAAVLCRPEMKCRLCSDSLELATLFGGLVRRPLDLVPFPQLPHDLVRSPRRFRPEGSAITVGFVGSCRENRGFLLLRAAIDLVLRDRPSACHFLVQAGGNPGSPPDVFMAEVGGLWAMPKTDVTMVVEITSTADYYALIHDCDIILLCYDPERYRYEPSGVFAEAITAGKVMVITAGTSMADEAERFAAGYVCNEDFTAPGIAAAIRQALAQYPVLAMRAQAAMSRAASFHNADGLISYLRGA